MGSSSPKQPTNTTQTVNQNNIPDFMQPYFNTLMGAAQNNVYQRDAQGNVTGMQPYQPYSTDGNDYFAKLTGLQNNAINMAGNLQVPGQYQQGSTLTSQSGMRGMNAGAGAMGIGQQAANAGNQYNRMATDPNALKGFMSPYMQNVVNYETQQANRQYDITGQEQQAAAARSGAFGGSREAIMGAENERNRNQAITGIQSTGAEKAFQNAQQAQQFGANLGMQGYDTGIRGMAQGIAGAQTGIAAGEGLGKLGAGQLGAQRDIMNSRLQMGTIQQQQQQQAIDQAVRNYEKAQAYPQEQMNFLSGLLRGFQPNSPSSSTVSNYQAQPNWMSQLFGGIGSLGSMYGAYNKKDGGIVGYSVGGSIESDLDQMNPEQLQEIIQTTTSDIERQMAKKLLMEKTMAGGGIVAFAQGGSMREQLTKLKPELEAARAEREQARIDAAKNARAGQPRQPMNAGQAREQLLAQEAAAAPKPTPGIEAVKPPSSWAEEGQSISGQAVKRGLGKVASTLGKGLGAAGALVGIAEGAAEPSELDKYLAVRAENGDVQAKQVLDSGGADAIMEKLKAPIRDVIGKLNVEGAWEALKGAVSGGIDSVQPPTEQPTLNQPTPLQAEPAPASVAQIPQDQGTLIPTGGIDQYGGGGDSYALQGISQAAPQAGVSSFDALIAEDQAKLNAAQDTPYETPEALLKRRAEIMNQRTNTADESKRQFNLRMADFFAHWGSTPGPVISAGLKALTETMPGFLKDKDDQEKLSRTLSEAQFQIDWADHLEKKGHTKDAAAVREKLSDTLISDKRLKAAAEAKFAETEMEQFNQNNRNYADNMTKYTTAQMTNAPGNAKNPLADNALTSIENQIKANDVLIQSQDPAVLIPEVDQTQYDNKGLDKLMANKRATLLKEQADLKRQRNDINKSALSGLGSGGEGGGGGQYNYSPKKEMSYLDFAKQKMGMQ